jgi:hypothetical protein
MQQVADWLQKLGIGQYEEHELLAPVYGWSRGFRHARSAARRVPKMINDTKSA